VSDAISCGIRWSDRDDADAAQRDDRSVNASSPEKTRNVSGTAFDGFGQSGHVPLASLTPTMLGIR